MEKGTVSRAEGDVNFQAYMGFPHLFVACHAPRIVVSVLSPGGSTMTVQTLRLVCRPGVALILALIGLSQSCSATAAKRASLESEMNEAMDQVREIVNQPVNPLRRTPEMQVSTYKPGWFHDGASKPAFIAIDVRRTQDTSYG